MPCAKPVPCDPTTAGVCPYSRSKPPIGGLSSPAGTVSITGARFTFTPAAAQLPTPAAPAIRRSVLADQVPCVNADGIEREAGPDSTCTSPALLVCGDQQRDAERRRATVASRLHAPS